MSSLRDVDLISWPKNWDKSKHKRRERRTRTESRSITFHAPVNPSLSIVLDSQVSRESERAESESATLDPAMNLDAKYEAERAFPVVHQTRQESHSRGKSGLDLQPSRVPCSTPSRRWLFASLKMHFRPRQSETKTVVLNVLPDERASRSCFSHFWYEAQQNQASLTYGVGRTW